MRMGITGHRGLTAPTEKLVRDALSSEVRRHAPNELVAVSCLSDGPDTWLAEAVLEHGGRLEAVIPALGFRAALPHAHHAAYDALFRRAAEVHATGLTACDAQAHTAAGELLVKLSDRLLAVWDGEESEQGEGGPSDVVTYAQDAGVPVRAVWPNGSARS